MRHLCIITALVGVLIYIPVTIKLAPASALPAGTIESLKVGLAALDADFTAVRLEGWAPGSPADVPRLQRRLGPQVVATHVEEYVAVTWLLTPDEDWPAAFRRLENELGAGARLAVQLEGLAAAGRPEVLAARAADALRLTGRQPWATSAAASLAGVSPLLPYHRSGVNAQVAVRLEKRGARVWVGWPVLNQEY